MHYASDHNVQQNSFQMNTLRLSSTQGISHVIQVNIIEERFLIMSIARCYLTTIFITICATKKKSVIILLCNNLLNISVQLLEIQVYAIFELYIASMSAY